MAYIATLVNLFDCDHHWVSLHAFSFAFFEPSLGRGANVGILYLHAFVNSILFGLCGAELDVQ